jgi:hypothetical protein
LPDGEIPEKQDHRGTEDTEVHRERRALATWKKPLPFLYVPFLRVPL